MSWHLVKLRVACALLQYFGGKQRIARRLAAHMAPAVARRGVYWEPFVGAASVLAATTAARRLASDSNSALINMWRALAAGWEPPGEVTEDTYKAVRLALNPDDPMTAFVGFGTSFAGKWFGGYARGGVGNYAATAVSSLRRKMKTLQGVEWASGDYREIEPPVGAVIYCDPPYQGTTQYSAVAPFSWDAFWAWCLERHAAGNIVFISEYAAPSDFVPSLEITTKTAIRTAVAGKEIRLERLFVPKGSDYGC